MERFIIMKITEHKKKNGTIVYRASIYLGIDQMTGKRVKTSITGRTRKEVNQKPSTRSLTSYLMDLQLKEKL